MTGQCKNTFGARSTLATVGGAVTYFHLEMLAKAGLANLDRLPFGVKILL